MKKKVLVSLVLVGTLTFAAGLGTMAWFTSQATSNDNTFKAGSVTISAPENNAISTGIVEISNIYPGWEQQKTVTVKNEGTLQFKYRVTAKSDHLTALYTSDNGLEVKVNDGQFMDIHDLNKYLVGIINPNSSKEITFTFRLPQIAGNEFKDLTDYIDFVFDATQVEDVTDGWNKVELINTYNTGKNADNKSLNRPYINYTVNGNKITLDFVNPTTNQQYAFDYRIDGEAGTKGNWADTIISGGELKGQPIGNSYHIVNVAPGQTVTKTVTATEEVWVGLRLGAENDYYLDWIKFKVQ